MYYAHMVIFFIFLNVLREVAKTISLKLRAGGWGNGYRVTLVVEYLGWDDYHYVNS